MTEFPGKRLNTFGLDNLIKKLLKRGMSKRTHRVAYERHDRRFGLIPSSPLSVCSDNIVPSKHVRDLGIYIDTDMSMRTHVSRTVSSCFAALRQIRVYNALSLNQFCCL